MSRAVLALLAGDVGGSTAAPVTPFRYARLTPFKLAMGLSMAAAVPRMRAAALAAVCDLVLEEETLRVRRGRGIDGRQRAGSSKPWLDCLVQCLEGESRSVYRGSGGGNHILGCLVSVANFAESEHHGNGGGGCAASLLQSLCQLGFLLVDCVKKDDSGSAVQSYNPHPLPCWPLA